MLKFNNNTPKRINFNGKHVAKVIFNNIVVWLEKILTTITGYPISLTNSTGEDLVDYKLYGNSIQDGTPTPDDPVEINSVGDKTKNLVSIKNFTTQTMNGVTYTNNGDGTITINGTATGWGQLNFTNIGKTLTGINGVASFVSLSGSYSGATSTYPRAVFLAPSNSAISYPVLNSANNYTFTSDKQINRFSFQHTAGNVFNNLVVGLQIEEGSTVTEYEPYGYKIPVKTRNKNFFDIDGFGTTSTLLVTKINSTSFTLTAKTTGTYRQSGTKYLIRVSDLKNNFLTVKAENVTKTSVGTPLFIIRQYDKNMQLLAQLKNCQLTTSEVKVDLSNLNSETAWLGGVLCLSNVNETAGSYCTITDLQIYDGADNSIMTNIYLDEPLRKIGDYSDYIDFENQKVVRNICKYELTGNETFWTKSSYYPGGYYLKNKNMGAVNYEKFLCNYAPCVSSISEYVIGTCYSDTTINFRFFDENVLATIDDWKNYIKQQKVNEKPIYIVYVLTTPIEEIIDLPNIPTLEDITVLQVNTKIQPSNMEVVYYKKNN